MAEQESKPKEEDKDPELVTPLGNGVAITNKDGEIDVSALERAASAAAAASETAEASRRTL